MTLGNGRLIPCPPHPSGCMHGLPALGRARSNEDGCAVRRRDIDTARHISIASVQGCGTDATISRMCCAYGSNGGSKNQRLFTGIQVP
jgi:hypothetical protein